MILNKFYTSSMLNSLKALIFQLLAWSLFSCNKTANIQGNKAFVGFTHIAYGFGPIEVLFDNTPLFVNPLSFGQTSGDSLNPYDTTVSQISDMVIKLTSDTAKPLLSGNAAFQQGEHYSAFVYDSVSLEPLRLIIFQDNPQSHTDTNTNVRYLNFSPGSSRWAIIMVSTRTKAIVTLGPANFVGTNPTPNDYKFSIVRIGNYDLFAFQDSTSPAPDSSNVKKLGKFLIDSLTNYNMVLQGFKDDHTSQDSMKCRLIPLN